MTYKLVTHHLTGVAVSEFDNYDDALRLGQDISPDTDGSMTPNIPAEVFESFGGDRTYERGIFWHGNRYAAIFNTDANYTRPL